MAGMLDLQDQMAHQTLETEATVCQGPMGLQGAFYEQQHHMNIILRILLAVVAVVTGLAAGAQYLALVPPYTPTISPSV